MTIWRLVIAMAFARWLFATSRSLRSMGETRRCALDQAKHWTNAITSDWEVAVKGYGAFVSGRRRHMNITSCPVL